LIVAYQYFQAGVSNVSRMMTRTPARKESRSACIRNAIETGIPLSTCWKSPNSKVSPVNPRSRSESNQQFIIVHLTTVRKTVVGAFHDKVTYLVSYQLFHDRPLLGRPSI